MSLNSFNPLPSLKSSVASDALTGPKAANNSTSLAPIGQEFSVYFERMMHPAFSSALNTSGSMAEPSTAAPSNPMNSNPSALNSNLLDPNSSTLAFSHNYLKAKASVADLKLNVPQSGSAQAHENANASNRSRATDSTHKNNKSTQNAVNDQPSKSAANHQDTRSDVHSRPDRVQSTRDRLNQHADSTVRDDSPISSDDSTPNSDPLAQGSLANASDPTTQADAQLKRASAEQLLSEQRLPMNAASDAPIDINSVSATNDLSNPALMDPSQNKGLDKLVSLALSDKTQIITTDDVPDEKSLADFARAMGFDEAQVASLFGPHAAQTMISNPKPNPSTSLNASASALEQNKSSLTASLGNSGLQSVLTLTESSAGTGTLANPLSKLPTAPEHGSMNTMNLLGTPLAIDSNLQMGVSPMPAQSVLTGLPGQALMTKSSQGTSTSAVNLAQLMSSEGIDPQGVQLNISTPIKNASASLNSALGGPSNSNMPSTSTLAVLNMTGSKLSENAIAALQKEFNQLRGLDKHEEKTSAFGIASSFDTTLSVSTSLQAGEAGNTSGNPSDGSSSGQNGTQNTQNTGSTVNMAETYEKLSEQLTAELSKRMHEQISQGQWKMKFALKPSTLGAVDVQLEMKDGKLAAVFQADNALTQNLLQHSSQQLKDNLKDLGLDQTYVQVDQQNAGQSQHNDQQNNGKNPFDAVSDAQSLANAQDSTPVVDASMKVKNNDSLLDLMA